MPKPYYPTPDELQGDTPLDERLWFDKYQSQLLRLANTNEGRDLLCIDSWRERPYPIVMIHKNTVKYYLGHWDDKHWFISDFRIGAKWGNVIRYRWRKVQKALDRMVLEELLALQPLALSDGRVLRPIAGASTLTVYPDPHPEGDTVDGRAGRNAVESWANMRTGAGDTSTATGTDCQCSISKASGTDWQGFHRSILLYDTSDLGGDLIDSATMELTASSKPDNFTGSVAMVQSTPASNTNIVNADYTQVGTTRQASDLTISGITANSVAYNPFVLIAAGLASISKTSITKFGIRIISEIDDDEPADGENDETSRVVWLSADNSGTTIDPKLVVLHTTPFVPKLMMF